RAQGRQRRSREIVASENLFQLKPISPCGILLRARQGRHRGRCMLDGRGPAGQGGSMEPDWQGALARAEAHSPFLARLLGRFPKIADLLASGRIDEALAAARSAGEDTADIPKALREERSTFALVLAVGDLAGY